MHQRRIVRIVTIMATGLIAVLLYNAFRPSGSSGGTASETARQVSGRVLTAATEPAVPGLWVRASWRDGDGVGSVSVPVGQDGTFTLTNLEPRRYLLTTRRGDGDDTNKRPLDAGFTTVTVKEADITDAVIVTRPAVDVVARIRYERAPGSRNGTPAPIVHARLVVPGFGEGDSVMGTRQDDGSVRFRDMFGPRLLSSVLSGADGARWRQQAVLFDGQDVTSIPTDFAARAGRPLEIVFVERPSTGTPQKAP